MSLYFILVVVISLVLNTTTTLRTVNTLSGKTRLRNYLLYVELNVKLYLLS